MPNSKWSVLLLLGSIFLSAAQDTAGQCTYGPGYYCGASIGKQADHLYYCENGVWSDNETCQYGCNQSKPGSPDYCFQGLNVTSPPQAFTPSSQLPSTAPSSAIPTPTNNNVNINVPTPAPFSITTSPVTSPSVDPSHLHPNMTLIWAEAIDTFISRVAHASHVNEHSDAVFNNMRGMIGLPRDPYTGTT